MSRARKTLYSLKHMVSEKGVVAAEDEFVRQHESNGNDGGAHVGEELQARFCPYVCG